MKVLLNTNGVGKSYVLENKTETYYKKLRAAYKDIQNDVQSEYLFFGFFTLCAATLEYSLNYILTNYCLTQFGIENYKIYAEGYTNLQFRKKLLMSPNIITSGKLVMKDNHHSFKTLEELISLRNKILHNKEFLSEFELPIKDFWGKDEAEFFIPLEVCYIDTLTKDKCLTFGNALDDFRKYIMEPAINDNVEANDMLRDI